MSDNPVKPPVLAWGAATHPGRVRAGNEDSFIAEAMVFGVADGMGGHEAGEVASEIAATTVRDRLLHGAAEPDLMVAAVVEANAAIFQGAHTNPEQRGMGTTLTAMAAMPPVTGSRHGRLVIANVGDSRTYLYRGGRLRRVTVDHSYVQELVSTGHITEMEARTHPRRNIVTRALGIEPTVRVDTWVYPLVKGDRFVLCSDGLVDEVDDIEIATVLAAHAQPAAAAEALVVAANTNGGRDNVTVVVVDVMDGESNLGDTAEMELDLDLDDAWAAEHDRLIDADAAALDAGAAAVPAAADVDVISTAAPAAPTPDDVLPAASAAAPATTVLSAMDAGEARARRSPLGWFLFGLALAAIVTVTLVVILAIRHNNDTPTPVTTTTTSVPASTTSLAQASRVTTALATPTSQPAATPTSAPTSSTQGT